MPEEKIKIKCTRCSSMFREKGSRIKNGLQLNCPNCNRLITFDTSSEDPGVRKAFQAARTLRAQQDAEATAAQATRQDRY